MLLALALRGQAAAHHAGEVGKGGGIDVGRPERARLLCAHDEREGGAAAHHADEDGAGGEDVDVERP